MEIVYKALNKDLTCTMGKGKFQYTVGKWIEEIEANVGQNGLHAALNPLDCLDYYSNIDSSKYYLAIADGDISEDGYGTRISCTRMKLVKELEIEKVVMHSMMFMASHPQLTCSSRFVKEDIGEVMYKFIIVRGKNPVAKGKTGDIIALMKEDILSPAIEEFRMFIVGEHGIQPDTYYNIEGKTGRLSV